MLIIRLQRTGRENLPTYRLVVSEKARHAKKGSLEILGHFLPGLKQPVFKFEKERITYWISKGAQPTDTVSRLLKKSGVNDMDKFMVRYAKQKSKKEKTAEASAAPAASPAAKAPDAEAPKA